METDVGPTARSPSAPNQHLNGKLTAPSSLERPGPELRESQFTVDYSRRGALSMPSPLFLISAGHTHTHTPPQTFWAENANPPKVESIWELAPMVVRQREARVYQLAFQHKVIQLHDEGLLTEDDAFTLYRTVQEIYYAYRDSTLSGKLWQQGESGGVWNGGVGGDCQGGKGR